MRISWPTDTEHIDRFTRPYEGIPELLRELVQRGVRLAVASNKFQIGTEKLVRIYFPSIRFDAVFGQRPVVPLKPDLQVVREILADTDAESGAVLYAGDWASIWIRPGQPVSGRSV